MHSLKDLFLNLIFFTFSMQTPKSSLDLLNLVESGASTLVVVQMKMGMVRVQKGRKRRRGERGRKATQEHVQGG